MHKHNKQSGRSMVEMLGVLAIVAVLSVGGIAGYSKAMAKYRISRTLDEIQMLVTGIRSSFAGAPDYSNVSNSLVYQAGIIPDSIIINKTMGISLKNSFGELIIITSWNAGEGFQITYNGLDKTTCVQLASADWGGSTASGFVGMTIKPVSRLSNGNNLPDNNWTAGNLPININDAAALCSSNTSTNSITWFYR